MEVLPDVDGGVASSLQFPVVHNGFVLHGFVEVELMLLTRYQNCLCE